MYLFVQPSGTRSWIQRLLVRGRRRELGLGSVALVPLAKAREKALANRTLARQGGDPLAEKRRTEGIPTFAEASARVLEQKRGRMAGAASSPGVDVEPESVRLPAHRQDAGLRGHQLRRA